MENVTFAHTPSSFSQNLEMFPKVSRWVQWSMSWVN